MSTNFARYQLSVSVWGTEKTALTSGLFKKIHSIDRICLGQTRLVFPTSGSNTKHIIRAVCPSFVLCMSKLTYAPCQHWYKHYQEPISKHKSTRKLPECTRELQGKFYVVTCRGLLDFGIRKYFSLWVYMFDAAFGPLICIWSVSCSLLSKGHDIMLWWEIKGFFTPSFRIIECRSHTEFLWASRYCVNRLIYPDW